eukprot:655292-Hanusia_phi.AAC.4
MVKNSKKTLMYFNEKLTTDRGFADKIMRGICKVAVDVEKAMGGVPQVLRRIGQERHQRKGREREGLGGQEAKEKESGGGGGGGGGAGDDCLLMQDIEGCYRDGKFYVVQTRPQRLRKHKMFDIHTYCKPTVLSLATDSHPASCTPLPSSLPRPLCSLPSDQHQVRSLTSLRCKLSETRSTPNVLVDDKDGRARGVQRAHPPPTAAEGDQSRRGVCADLKIHPLVPPGAWR